MSPANWALVVIAAALLAYLMYSLLLPERF